MDYPFGFIQLLYEQRYLQVFLLICAGTNQNNGQKKEDDVFHFNIFITIPTLRCA
jgi:hypothetical protein